MKLLDEFYISDSFEMSFDKDGTITRVAAYLYVKKEKGKDKREKKSHRKREADEQKERHARRRQERS